MDLDADGHGINDESRDRRYRVPTNDEQFEYLKIAFKQVNKRDHSLYPARKYLGKGEAKLLYGPNPWAGEMWANFLKEAITGANLPGSPFFVTILNENEWAINLRSSRWRTERLLTETRKVELENYIRRQFRKLDYLFQLDFAIHRMPTAQKAFFSPHYHGIVWGDKTDIASRLDGLFPGYGDAPGGMAKLVYNLDGALAYMAKDTRCRYATNIKIKEGGGLQRWHYREPLTKKHRLMMLAYQSDYTKPELCFGSNGGLRILKAAIKAAEGRGYLRYEGGRPGGSRKAD